jgi:hypothetical protein
MKFSRTSVMAGAAVAALATSFAFGAPVLASASSPAAAPAPHGASAPVRGGDPASTVDRVADFYGAYIDSVYSSMGGLGADLRAHYLTKSLQTQLAAWEKVNHADGVLRAQSVPNAWVVTSDGAGAGHAFTTVTFTWGTGASATHTHVSVQSDLATGLIAQIK